MEYYKVVKDIGHKNYYRVIQNPNNLLSIIESKVQPFCYFENIYEQYNFSLEDFFKYIIKKFNAIIFIIHDFPYFSVVFSSFEDAENFCNELNERI